MRGRAPKQRPEDRPPVCGAPIGGGQWRSRIAGNAAKRPLAQTLWHCAGDASLFEPLLMKPLERDHGCL